MSSSTFYQSWSHAPHAFLLRTHRHSRSTPPSDYRQSMNRTLNRHTAIELDMYAFVRDLHAILTFDTQSFAHMRIARINQTKKKTPVIRQKKKNIIGYYTFALYCAYRVTIMMMMCEAFFAMCARALTLAPPKMPRDFLRITVSFAPKKNYKFGDCYSSSKFRYFSIVVVIIVAVCFAPLIPIPPWTYVLGTRLEAMHTQKWIMHIWFHSSVCACVCLCG